MSVEQSLLGKETLYKTAYDPGLLFPISRQINRDKIGVNSTSLPFVGVDIWNAYELSWLDSKGKPRVAILEFHVPIDSPNLVESKSIKLYLNSFNQTKLDNVSELQRLIEQDLSQAAGKAVSATITLPGAFKLLHLQELSGRCIDDLALETDCYHPRPEFLQASGAVVEETLLSHLLRSNCPVTNQPDWGAVQIYYRGPEISHEGLLKYIVSFREHNEFHEQCVERMFVDIMKHCRPTSLAVYARYTRRGGLDINPMRANFAYPVENARGARQ